MTDRLPDVPMKAITVRMGQDVYDRIAEAAAEGGISISQYLRESALARVWFTHGLAGDTTSEISRALLAIVRDADGEEITLEEYLERLKP